MMSEKNRRIHSFVDVEICGNSAGRIVLELFSDVCPKTCNNFISLCNGESVNNEVIGFKGSSFVSFANSVRVKCSCTRRATAEMLRERVFPGEVSVLKHFKELLLSTAIRGPEADGLHWIITTECTPELDCTHLVFGRVVSGQGVVGQMHDALRKNGYAVKVANCGELKTRTLDHRKPPTIYRSSVRYSSPEASDSSNPLVERTDVETLEKSFTLASLLKKSNRLLRGSATTLISSRERKIRGRGTVRYRASSSKSRSRSETPPHWRTELDKAKYCKRDSEDASRDRWIKGDKLSDSYDNRSERRRRSNSSDSSDYCRYRARRSQSDRSKYAEEDQSRSRGRSNSYSNQYTNERYNYSSESSTTPDGYMERQRYGARRYRSSGRCRKSSADFSERGGLSCAESSKRKSNHHSQTSRCDKLRKKEKSSNKLKKHFGQNWMKNDKSADRTDNSIVSRVVDVKKKDQDPKLCRVGQSECHRLPSSTADNASVSSESSSLPSESVTTREKYLKKIRPAFDFVKTKNSTYELDQKKKAASPSSEDRSQQNAKEKCKGRASAETHKSNATRGKEPLVYKTRNASSVWVENDSSGIKIDSTHVQNMSHSGHLEQAISSNVMYVSKCSSSDDESTSRAILKNRKKKLVIKISCLRSDKRSEDMAKVLMAHDVSDFPDWTDRDAIDAKSLGEFVVKILSSGEDETKHRALSKRTNYDSNFVDIAPASCDMPNKHYRKLSKNAHSVKETGFTESDKMAASANMPERHWQSSDENETQTDLLSSRGGTTNNDDYNHVKNWKKCSVSKVISGKKSRDVSQQNRFCETKKERRQSQCDSDAYAHSELSWTYLNRSRDESLLSSRESIRSRDSRDQHQATARCNRLSLSGSSRNSSNPKRRGRSSSSHSCHSSHSYSYRSKSWKSSRSSRRSSTSRSRSSSFSRSNSRSIPRTGKKSNLQKQQLMPGNVSPHNDTWTVVAKSSPSRTSSIPVATNNQNSAMQILSDSPPPSRWKPGQKPWQPRKASLAPDSGHPGIQTSNRLSRTSKSKSVRCSTQIEISTQKENDTRKLSEERRERHRRSRRKGSSRTSSSEKDHAESRDSRRRRDWYDRRGGDSRSGQFSQMSQSASTGDGSFESGSGSESGRSGSFSSKALKLNLSRNYSDKNRDDSHLQGESETTNFLKWNSDNKKKRRASQAFQWQPPVEPEYFSSAEDDRNMQTAVLNQLSIRRRRKQKDNRDFTGETGGDVTNRAATGDATSRAGGDGSLREPSKRSEPEDRGEGETPKQRNRLETTVGLTDQESTHRKTECELANSDSSAMVINYRYDPLDAAVKDGRSFTSNDRSPLPCDLEKTSAVEVDGCSETLSAVCADSIKAMANVSYSFRSSLFDPDHDQYDLEKAKLSDRIETEEFDRCVEAENSLSESGGNLIVQNGTAHPAEDDRISTCVALESREPVKPLLFILSRSGLSKLSKLGGSDNRLLGKQLNFTWKSRSKIYGSANAAKLDSPESPCVSGKLPSPQRSVDYKNTFSEDIVLLTNSLKKFADRVDAELDTLTKTEQNLESKSPKSVEESAHVFERNSVGRSREYLASARRSSSRRSSHSSKIYISSNSDDESRSRSRSFKSRSPSVLRLSTQSHSSASKRDRSDRISRSVSDSRSHSYSVRRTRSRRSSDSAWSRSIDRSSCEIERARSESGKHRRRGRGRRRGGRSESRSASGSRSKSRSRSGNRQSRRRYASFERSSTNSRSSRRRTKCRTRYRRHYSSSDDDSRSRSRSSSSSQYYRRHSKRSRRSDSDMSYRRSRSSRKSYRYSSSSS